MSYQWSPDGRTLDHNGYRALVTNPQRKWFEGYVWFPGSDPEGDADAATFDTYVERDTQREAQADCEAIIQEATQ